MRYELSNKEWSIIRAMLPTKPRGVPRVDPLPRDHGLDAHGELAAGAPGHGLGGVAPRHRGAAGRLVGVGHVFVAADHAQQLGERTPRAVASGGRIRRPRRRIAWRRRCVEAAVGRDGVIVNADRTGDDPGDRRVRRLDRAVALHDRRPSRAPP